MGTTLQGQTHANKAWNPLYSQLVEGSLACIRAIESNARHHPRDLEGEAACDAPSNPARPHVLTTRSVRLSLPPGVCCSFSTLPGCIVRCCQAWWCGRHSEGHESNALTPAPTDLAPWPATLCYHACAVHVGGNATSKVAGRRRFSRGLGWQSQTSCVSRAGIPRRSSPFTHGMEGADHFLPRGSCWCDYAELSRQLSSAGLRNKVLRPPKRATQWEA